MVSSLLRWTGYLLGTVVLLVILAVGGIYLYSELRMRADYEVTVDTLTVRADSATLARGRHFARTRGCRDCHGNDFGGTTLIDDPMMGTLAGSNLTSGEGGIGDEYGKNDWIRSIRHGVGPDGRPLVFMPSYEYAPMGREDLAALIAYLERLPPVDRPKGPVEVGPMGRLLYVSGRLPQLLSAEIVEHDRRIPTAPSVDSSATYGEYLAVTCTGCHGEDLAGGPIPGAPPSWPPATNITPHPEEGIGPYGKEEFIRAVRTGQRPNGEMIDDVMPFGQFQELTRTEVVALWNYLQTVPPRPTGG